VGEAISRIPFVQNNYTAIAGNPDNFLSGFFFVIQILSGDIWLVPVG
jgi:hypothetical protein